MFVAPLFCWALPFFSSLAVWWSVSCFSPLLLECCGPLHLTATTSMATAYTHACTHTWECTKNTRISCWPIFVCLPWRCGGLLPWRQSDRAAQEAGDCLGWTITLPVGLRCEFIHLWASFICSADRNTKAYESFCIQKCSSLFSGKQTHTSCCLWHLWFFLVQHYKSHY